MVQKFDDAPESPLKVGDAVWAEWPRTGRWFRSLAANIKRFKPDMAVAIDMRMYDPSNPVATAGCWSEIDLELYSMQIECREMEREFRCHV